MNQLERLAALVERTQNLALPEAERLRMPSGWEQIGEVWKRPIDGLYDYEHVYAHNPDPIDLEAASGVLAEWLAKTELRIVCHYIEVGYCSSWWVFSRTSVGWPVATGLSGYPTMLDAQLAAAEAVLGVGR